MRHVDSFRVVDRTGRQIFTIHEIAHDIPVQSFDGSSTMEGLHEFRVDRGGVANRISDDEFEIVATGVRVWRLPD
jgi:hypothetical protein